MKFLSHAILMLSLIGVAMAQAPTFPAAAPNIEVVENGWRKVIRNPALDDDPLRAGRETIEYEQAKRDAVRVNQVLRDLGRDPIPPPTRSSSGIRMGNSSVTYIYEAKIRNTGTKTVRTVVWQYAMFDTDKHEEVGRTSCTSKVNLHPGKTVDLVGTSSQSPIGVIDVSKSGKEIKGAYTERVVINRIEYDDGSSWQRPLN
ncbi:MAG: hypothetical protein QOF62_3180 [Pyrinomonadaceae bacterium]|jgi:hypothetical protein|nr:hypothetical protein [Pyrinomonadaceae bacterium]